LAVALAGCLLFFGLAGILPSSRYITGALLLAIEVPFTRVFYFNSILCVLRTVIVDSGRAERS